MKSELGKRVVTGIVLVFGALAAYWLSGYLFVSLLLAAWLYMMHLEWPCLIGPMYSKQYVAVSLFYPTLPMFLLMYLVTAYRETDFLLPLVPYIIASAADIGGYIVGKQFGKHKVWPQISPGKSWEGCFGSFVAVLAAHIFTFPYVVHELFHVMLGKPKYLLLSSLVFTLVAFAGGMFFSWLKRKQGLKDAGSLLPGHGGLMDRLDTAMFVVLPVVVLIKMFG